MKRVVTGMAALLIVFLLTGCSDHKDHESLLKRIRSETSHQDSSHHDSSASTPSAALTHLYNQVRKVSYWDSTRNDTVFFQDRRPSIKQFPCAECHAGHGKVKGDRRAHFGLGLRHADSTVMSCATCHGDGMKANTLVTLGGKSVPFEYSFQVCSQCHFQQARDVLGGAHGKRLLGWQGPRIIQNCAACHNPHAPALPSRWPATTETRGELK